VQRQKGNRLFGLSDLSIDQFFLWPVSLSFHLTAYLRTYILSGVDNREEKPIPPRIKWEGDSRKETHSWPKPPRANIGGDLTRLAKGDDPLDAKHLTDRIFELRDEHQNVWYRLLYWMNAGWIYVLHCFTKKTNETPQADLKLAKDRKRRVIKRKDEPFPKEDDDDAQEESA
jgi:phage-related protein